MTESKSYIIRNLKFIIFVIITLGLILFIFEIQTYYFPLGKLNNSSLLEALKRNPNINTSISNDYKNKLKEQYKEVRFDLDKEYKNIFDYLENSDYTEKQFKNKDENIGCFDNNSFIEDIKGIGNSCKTLARTIKDINKKNLLHSNGNLYSYAEVCPETAGQSRPIMCLYNQGSYIRELNKQVANVIDHVQDNQGIRLNNLDNTISYHIVDNNRLFNMPQVKKFNKYEQDRNMGIERKYTNEDQLDDLILYNRQNLINIR